MRILILVLVSIISILVVAIAIFFFTFYQSSNKEVQLSINCKKIVQGYTIEDVSDQIVAKFKAEIMKNYPEDIFEKPILYRDINNRIRVKNWDTKKMYKRISYLCENEDYYRNYSAKIKSENKPEIINKKFRKSLLNFLEILKDI